MMRRIIALGVGAFLVLLAGGATQASAATCERGLLGGGPSGWEFDESDGEFSDATLFTEIGFDGVREDAFDDYGLVQVDGNDYVNPNEDGCRYPPGKREALFPADNLGGISVKPQLYANKAKPMGRLFVALRNTTAAPLTVEFAWDGDLGASDAVVGATTSGDQSMNQGDRWGTTCEDSEADGCANTSGDDLDRDPELAHNWEGKGQKPHSADLVFDPELADGDTRFQFDDVTIGAGKTVTFLQVVSLAPTIKAANKAARAIDKDPAKYGVFAGLSKKERKRLQNW